jgi:dephospho-CoA kinase
VSQRVIGLTGGIATGKSTVANYLRDRFHIPILDADLYAREAVTPELLGLLVQRYGEGILTSDRSLNRQQLGKIIFQDRQERQWLEHQIHPHVRSRLQVEAADHFPDAVVMVVPLLFEANMQDLVTETWVVACGIDVQLARLMQRDRLSRVEAELRLASQIAIAEKIKMADIVIDNSGDLAQLPQQIDHLI